MMESGGGYDAQTWDSEWRKRTQWFYANLVCAGSSRCAQDGLCTVAREVSADVLTSLPIGTMAEVEHSPVLGRIALWLSPPSLRQATLPEAAEWIADMDCPLFRLANLEASAWYEAADEFRSRMLSADAMHRTGSLLAHSSAAALCAPRSCYGTHPCQTGRHLSKVNTDVVTEVSMLESVGCKLCNYSSPCCCGLVEDRKHLAKQGLA